MAKIRLPILVERSIAEATIARTRLSQSYEANLRDKAAGTTITCAKGCSACCHHPILASLFEGISIYRWLADNHSWTAQLKEKLVAAAEQVQGLSLEVWLLSNLPCAFLTKENTCSIYPARPFACRVTYSIGDPYYCHPHRIGEATGILPKRELFDLLTSEEAALLKQHGLMHFRFPLAKAVLYGERIAKGEVELEDAGTLL